MKAEEKAKELLFEKYGWIIYSMDKYHAKKCALICVDEILKEYAVLQIETSFCYKQYLYWVNVKKEIEKL